MDIGRVIAWALERTPVRAFLRYSERRGAMLLVRIVQAQRQVIGALAVQPVDAKDALGGAAVALPGLVAIGGKAQRDVGGVKCTAASWKKRALTLRETTKLTLKNNGSTDHTEPLVDTVDRGSPRKALKAQK